VALGKLGKPAGGALQAVLKGADRDVRAAAAYALGRIGPDARDAVPALLEMSRSDDAYARLAATQALKKIDPQAAKSDPP
jgi:HEAT repeat protein